MHQGSSLAIHQTTLFPEPIEAWTHGPVVPVVWQKFKDHGSYAISPDAIHFDENALTQEEEKVVKITYGEFGQYSAWKLRDMTHAEPPWKLTGRNQVMKVELIKDYFDSIVTLDG